MCNDICLGAQVAADSEPTIQNMVIEDQEARDRRKTVENLEKKGVSLPVEEYEAVLNKTSGGVGSSPSAQSFDVENPKLQSIPIPKPPVGSTKRGGVAVVDSSDEVELQPTDKRKDALIDASKASRLTIVYPKDSARRFRLLILLSCLLLVGVLALTTALAVNGTSKSSKLSRAPASENIAEAGEKPNTVVNEETMFETQNENEYDEDFAIGENQDGESDEGSPNEAEGIEIPSDEAGSANGSSEQGTGNGQSQIGSGNGENEVPATDSEAGESNTSGGDEGTSQVEGSDEIDTTQDQNGKEPEPEGDADSSIVEGEHNGSEQADTTGSEGDESMTGQGEETASEGGDTDNEGIGSDVTEDEANEDTSAENVSDGAVVEGEPSCVAEISIGPNCFPEGQSIGILFQNCNATRGDWLGIFPANADATELEDDDIIFWVYTCGSRQPCSGSGEVNSNLVSITGGLEVGQYKAHLIRGGSDDPYSAYGTSEEFRVRGTEEDCEFYGK